MYDDNDLITIGYYICNVSVCSEYLGIKSNKFVSASECLCDHEPQIFLCHGWKPNGDNLECIRNYFSSKEEYLKMSAEIMDLLNEGLVETDGCFHRKEDALYFYKGYFNDSRYMLISVSMPKKCFQLLDKKFRSKINVNVKKEPDENIIGNDIIGWDMDGFHSFLCNSLHEMFSDIQFNDYGLLNEDYEKTIDRAQRIQGMGEPVDWVPVILHEIKIYEGAR